jgi:hypothetical protein
MMNALAMHTPSASVGQVTSAGQTAAWMRPAHTSPVAPNRSTTPTPSNRALDGVSGQQRAAETTASRSQRVDAHSPSRAIGVGPLKTNTASW